MKEFINILLFFKVGFLRTVLDETLDCFFHGEDLVWVIFDLLGIFLVVVRRAAQAIPSRRLIPRHHAVWVCLGVVVLRRQ